VIGVVRDFHITSLRERVRPTLLHGSALDATSSNLVLVRLNPGSIPEALDFVKTTWESFVPSIPFDYSFLDQEFDAMYRAERRLGRILLMFTGIAVLLGCMGLFGMAAFTAQQRTKEIGIRKVLGATSGAMIRLLTVEFARLVIIAALVAAPVAYIGASRWLEHFAYRVSLGPGTLILAGLVALAAAMATVAYHAWQVARMNPADSLRYE
jgi:putative ABC transport system permease protein